MKTDNPNRIYLGKSSKYIKDTSRFKNRFKMILRILSDGNCILLSDIHEFIEDDKRGRLVSIYTSTNYDSESDYLSAVAAANILEERI